MARPPIFSVVDYNAWDKGYTPPTEHILIDRLSYRGARVVLSSFLGGDSQLWVVLEGTKPLTNGQRKNLRNMIALWFEDEEPQSKPDAPPAEVSP